MGNSPRRTNKKGKQFWPSECRISVTSRECFWNIPFGMSFLCPFSDHLLVKIWPNNSDQLPKYRQISHKVERKKHYQVKFIGNATKGKSYNFLKISMKIISRSIQSQGQEQLCVSTKIAKTLSIKSPLALTNWKNTTFIFLFLPQNSLNSYYITMIIYRYSTCQPLFL